METDICPITRSTLDIFDQLHPSTGQCCSSPTYSVDSRYSAFVHLYLLFTDQAIEPVEYASTAHLGRLVLIQQFGTKPNNRKTNAMKINPISVRRIVVTSLLCFGLTASSLQAQTFIGKKSLNEQPGTLQAAVYPILNSPKIRVRYEHYDSGPVRIQVQNEQGELVFDHYEYKRKYNGQFDLSLLPAGLYTIGLQTSDSRYMNQIQIAAPVAMRVSLVNQPSSVPARPEKLIVSH